MTIKEKFSSIDQSKLTADQKSFLDKIKNVTKNFSDAEMNKKVEQPLDNFIAKAKEKMPEAIKSAPVKRTAKAKTSQTRKPKRTAMSLAKEIRKEGETWKDAQVRARKMMKEGSQEVSKTVETELDKLSKLVRSQKERKKLTGLSGTNIKRDSVRRAKPKGRRISKDGNVYYENRDNRTDRLAPNYPKNAPFLAEGGYLTDPTFGTFQNQVLAEGGDIDAFTLRMVKSNGMQPAEVLKEDANVRYNRGGSVTNERRYVNKGEDYEVRYSKPILRRKGYQGKRDFELGGVMTTDLAGHTGGGDAGLNAGMPLDGFSNTGYTGLVGETGAMSSGEMFMAGGSVGNFDVKLLVGKRVVYEAKVDTLKKAQRIGTEILSWEDDGFEYTIIGYDSSNNKIFENKRLLSDEFPDRLKDKFATLKLNVIVANPKQNKLDAGSFTTYKSLLNIVDDFEEANYRVTINGKTFYDDDYELGGGLPSGAEQSYMITEAFGNPAQHFKLGGKLEGKEKQINMLFKNQGIKEAIQKEQADAIRNIIEKDGISTKGISDKEMLMIARELSKENYAKGGGVRQVGNREYSYGRNWTNDHRHINKAEDHEVKYTRKGKFLGIFDDGGMMNEKEFSLAQAIAFIKDAKKDRMTFYYNVYGGNDYFTLQPTFATPTGKLKGYPSKVTITKEGSITGRNLTYAYGGMTNLTIQDVSFATGGAIKNQYAGRTPEDVWNNWTESQKSHFIHDHLTENNLSFLKSKGQTKDVLIKSNWDSLTSGMKIIVSEHISMGEYNKGGALTNERLHVNHDEDYEVRYAKPRPKRKGYKGVRKFMAGGSMETPRIYVADLEAYNNGRLVGEWLDLDDYNDADELMDAIQDVLKKSGGEEYAIHDYENFPSNLYSEYMSRNDFQALYDVMETAKRNDLPLEVVQDIVSQYGEGGVEEFQGKYDNAEDFAQQLVDDIGIESFNDYRYYLDVSETDRRLLAQEMADSYVDDIRNEDGGNRLIEEAGMDVLEYQEADNQTQEEMLDEAREIVYNEYYDNWYDGLNDPYEFLVNEQGLYSPDDFAKANFVRVDYEKLGDALEQDYTFIEYDGDLYVFNIR